MAYKVKMQLRDTVLEAVTKAERDAKFDDIVAAIKALGIPDDNLILTKVDTKVSTFTGNEEEKVMGSNAKVVEPPVEEVDKILR